MVTALPESPASATEPTQPASEIAAPGGLRGPVACVDLETTGGAAAHHRVIEIGIVLLDRGAVVEEWSSLVNPGCPIPGGVTAITGIDDDMLASAPRFEELEHAIRSRLMGRLFVAHNAGFDYGFLRTEFRRIGVRYSAPRLCTVRLSRTLFPDEHGHSLDALIGRLALACDARHRALPDARVLPALLAAFEAGAGRVRLDAAVADLIQAVRLPPGLPEDLAEELPESPGAYVFRGQAGVVLYVGMGRNLRSRVLAHLCGRDRDEQLIRELRDVDWFEAGGELGALLLEQRLIRELEPLSHRRLRTARVDCLIRVCESRTGAVVCVEPVDSPAPREGDEAYGPFGSERAARRALESRAREAELCLKVIGLESGDGSCLARQLGHCRGACLGLEPRALHDARLKLALAPLRLRSWPFRGAVAIRERSPAATGSVLHVIDRWRHVGSATSEEELKSLASTRTDGGFDPDMYRIVSRWLERGDPRACIPLPIRGPDE
jgi:DNA polymerase-3 subunit epsilon